MSHLHTPANGPGGVDRDGYLPPWPVDYPNVLTCDACGVPIERPGQGMLRWLSHAVPTGSPPRRSRLTVVHHASYTPSGRHADCYVPPPADCSWGDEHLAYVCGAEGVCRLLKMVNCDGLPFLEAAVMIHRLLVPGYEQARRYERQAAAEALLDAAPLDGLLRPQDVREMLLHVDRWEEEMEP
ncbi:hypothetical protein [Alienimonas sp. DA493]|uniref:hypothetical protein n=1 Tax=Alienimonas sp. DA493 TaxID=3373605 RepID=UPI003754AA51